MFARAREVYRVYAERSDPLANVRALLPPGLKIVGFLGDADDIDISFWRPDFSTRVEHVLLEDTPEEIARAHVRYVVVGSAFLAFRQTTFAQWRQRVGAELLATATATLKVAQGPQEWYVVRMPEPPGSPSSGRGI